ncbi:hypothetical protein [Clavibacter michiganensis]|uniref:hypothetical protein n=1 Tax=Clavibacter michiganensis TaxID=28447 RepID=UPI001BE01E6C|nr:hypothetical protein [Clavibacter michiganensis]MBT1636794.1 hypothetical protein [Clavibacter michiganensis]
MQQRTTMHISGRDYVLADDQDPGDVQRRALAAVRAGGAMVRVGLAGARVVDVLVSPGIPLVFLTVDLPEDDELGATLTSPIDIPDYDHWLSQ